MTTTPELPLQPLEISPELHAAAQAHGALRELARQPVEPAEYEPDEITAFLRWSSGKRGTHELLELPRIPVDPAHAAYAQPLVNATHPLTRLYERYKQMTPEERAAAPPERQMLQPGEPDSISDFPVKEWARAAYQG